MKIPVPGRPGSNQGKLTTEQAKLIMLYCEATFIVICCNIKNVVTILCSITVFEDLKFSFPCIAVAPVCMESTACRTFAKRNRSLWSATW